MAANIQQSVLDLLERYPAIRGSTNALVLAYWIRVDGYPTAQHDFGQTTSLESIVREAREVWRKRPDLSPTANPINAVAIQQVFVLFPATEVV